MPEQLHIVVEDRGGVPSGGSAVATPGASPGRRGGGVVVAPPIQPPGPPRPPGGGTSSSAFSAIGSTRNVLGTIAGGQIAGGIGAAAGFAATAAGGPVGIVIAGTVAAFAVATTAVKTFASAVESETKRLAGHSIDLAIAQSQTELRREMADMQRAQRIGPRLAELEDVRSRLETELSEVATEILNVALRVLEVAEPFVEIAIRVLDAFGKFLERWGDDIGRAILVLVRLNPLVRLVELIYNLMVRETERNEGDQMDPHVRALFELLPRRGGRGRDRDAPLFWPRGQGAPAPNGV